ncbi:MAG: sensor histidine kinase [Sphingomonadaceae bacterium]
MITNFFAGRFGRASALAIALLTVAVILVVDLCFSPRRVPIRILYAIPIMLAARFVGLREATLVTLVAIAFSLLDGWLTGIDIQTEILATVALGVVGVLSLLWARAERRAAALAEERAGLHQQARQRAAESEDARERLLHFFALVAHDLRNPLTAISGYTQMLSRWDSLPPETRERVVKGIQLSLRQLTRLSNDLLDASRIGASRFEIQRYRCDLVALCREIVGQRRTTTSVHRLVMETQLDRLEGCFDCDRIAQAVGNLIDNAIKYSPAGGEVKVRLERVGDRARIEVSDQGIGIAPEDIDKLFQPYSRLHRGPEIRGMGLGLYIVRAIVEAHEGTITVQSQLGKGSTFTIDLPVRTQPAAPEA